MNELEAENQKLVKAYQQLYRTSRGPLAVRNTNSLAPAAKATTESSHSYLQPTTASRARSAVKLTVSAHSEIDATQCSEIDLQYDDGQLVQKRTLENTGYLRHTRASSRRAGFWDPGKRGTGVLVTTSAYIRNSRRRNVDSNYDCCSCWGSCECYSHDSGYNTADFVADAEDSQSTCAENDSLDNEVSSIEPDTLNMRSRLGDDKFYSESPAAACNVPHKIQVRLMRSALRLAQETLWCHLRVECPSFQRYRYLEGPSEVRFGVTELDNAFSPYGKEAAKCGGPNSKGAGGIWKMHDLRNAAFHPKHLGPRKIDEHIAHAQSLAVMLHDEPRAMKIRKLRDRLQSEASKAYDEIEAFEPLANLPQARPWALHHQRLFAYNRFQLKNRPESKTPEITPVVKRATLGWMLKYCDAGEMNPDYLANLEGGMSYVQRADKRRRASFSGMSAPREVQVPSAVEHLV